jgi:alanine racemase
MSFSIHDIAKIAGGQLAQEHENLIIERLLIDSRKLTHASDGLFFAIRSERNDGHKYVSDAYRAGVRNFVVEQLPDLALLPKANVVVVKNSVKALQLVAAAHRKQYTIPVVGITGSNGKTIVKEWLNQLLCDDFNLVRSPKSYNSQIGVPLSVWNMETVHTLALFEAGISMPGEMDELAKIIAPTIGIFTSIGSAHSENFLSKRQLIGEKLNLFAHCPVVICPEDGDIAALIPAAINDIVAAAGSPESVVTARRLLEQSGIDVDYLAVIDPVTLEPAQPNSPARVIIAARVGSTRLIDNMRVRD